MAIQHRRGKYADFDPSKLLPGEIAVVLSGDPASNTGRSIYICFEAGVVKRFATYEDFETEIQNATEEIQATFTEEIRNAANAAITATEAANKAVESAQAATEAANKAAEAAGAYVLGDLSNNVVTFDMASEKALPASGENMATLFGKVTKYLSDLVSGAISNVIGVNLVANRALVSDANGKIGAAEVTATELGYLSGVTSKVQTQFDELNTNRIGFIDTTKQITKITTHNASYTATENCWVVGSVQQTAVNGTAAVFLDGKDVALAQSTSEGSGLFGLCTCFPVMKGQIVSTRSNTGAYNLFVYGMK